MKAPDTATLQHLITEAMEADDWATVNDLEPRLDAVAQPKQPPTLLAAALWYAEQGLKVFPLQPRSKLPHKGTRGFKDASLGWVNILTWWDRWPDSNIGIATGHLIDVIDIDGPVGVHSWAQMINTLPQILGVVSTPRPGGNHLYVAATGDGNSAGIFPGVDVRGLGGYVVCPPSANEAGVRYTWRRPLALP